MGLFDSLGSAIGSVGSALEPFSGAIGAGASLFGGLSAQSANKKLQEDAQFFAGNEARYLREFNAAEAQKARDFAKTMSSTAVQRHMADLKAAGLNPLLAAKNLGGTAPPTSAAAASQGGTPGAGLASIRDAYTPAVQTGLSMMKTQAEVRKMDEEINNIIQDTALKLQNTYLSSMQTRKAQKEIYKLMADERLSWVRGDAQEMENMVRQIEVEFLTNTEWVKEMQSAQVTPKLIFEVLRHMMMR